MVAKQQIISSDKHKLCLMLLRIIVYEKSLMFVGVKVLSGFHFILLG